MSGEKVIVVTVALWEADAAYARRLSLAVEEILKRDEQDGQVRVSVMRLP